MCKVIDEFHIHKYAVMILDKMPEHSYYYFIIDGKKYKPLPVYDAKNTIAVESDKSFIGKTVEFINESPDI